LVVGVRLRALRRNKIADHDDYLRSHRV
jgi:hypothetical protein